MIGFLDSFLFEIQEKMSSEVLGRAFEFFFLMIK